MHYLVKIFEQKDPSVLTLQEQLPHLSEAVKVPLEDLIGELTALKTSMNSYKKIVSNAEKHPNDKFKPVLEVISFKQKGN